MLFYHDDETDDLRVLSEDELEYIIYCERQMGWYFFAWFVGLLLSLTLLVQEHWILGLITWMVSMVALAVSRHHALEREKIFHD